MAATNNGNAIDFKFMWRMCVCATVELIVAVPYVPITQHGLTILPEPHSPDRIDRIRLASKTTHMNVVNEADTNA